MSLSKLKNWGHPGSYLCCSLMFLLSGCEAPLNLEAVNQQNQESVQRIDFYQSMVADDNGIIAVGNNGLVITSVDGKNWQREVLPDSGSLLKVDICPNGDAVALSFDSNVWHKAHDSQTWNKIAIPTTEQLMDFTCSPDGNWWVAGSFSTIMNSTNNGDSWQTYSLQEDAIITNISFVSASQAIATAEYGMILTTSDNGENWDVTGYLPGEFYPQGALFISADTGWVSGLNGFIYRTDDGGESWIKEQTDTAVPIYQLIEANGELLGLGENTTIVKRNSSGWETIVQPSAPVYLRAAATTADGVTHVAGGRGVLMSLLPSQISSKE